MARRAKRPTMSSRITAVLSRRSRFKQADLTEHAREIVDAPFADDLIPAELIEEYGRHAKVLPARRQSHQSTEVRPFEGQDLCDMVAVDEQALGAARHVREGV